MDETIRIFKRFLLDICMTMYYETVAVIYLDVGFTLPRILFIDVCVPYKFSTQNLNCFEE